MRRINPLHRFRLFNRFDVRKIHGDGLAVAAHEDAFELFVVGGVDLLVL